MEGKNFIGVDVGGTSIKAGIVRDLIVIEDLDVPTPKTRHKFDDVVSKIIRILCAKAEIEAIGLGVPGLVDYEKGKVIYCPNLEFDIDEIKTDLPIYIGNDADMALTGELEFHPEDKLIPIALLTIGTGLGGAISVAGKMPYELNLSGEIGHMKIVANGKKCSCGQKGCLQAYASGRAIEESSRESVVNVFKAAEEGERKAQKIIYEFSEMLGVGIANLVNILGVEKVILAGKIAKSAETLFKFMHESDKNNIFAFDSRPFSIRASKNIDEIGIIGAARFAKIKHFDKR